MESLLTYLLLIIAILFALLDLIAVSKNWVKAERILKPAVIIALLAWVCQIGGLGSWMVWFAVGLFFSLLGDILLMFQKESLFVAGLVAFFFAHASYVIGFNPTFPPITFVTVFLFIMISITAATFYRQFVASIKESGDTGLLFPALGYSIILALMTFSAVATLSRSEWKAIPSLLVSAGAISFMISDSLLAWNKFISPINHSRFLVMVTYFLAQIAITLGAAWQYLPL